ncbi:MAG TPA: hypothetical protein VIM79_18980 [Niastella sp.]
MYSFFLALHSLVRWFVLISLLIALYRAWSGLLLKKPFSKFDNFIRHTTATIAQTQMLLGIVLYCISPLVRYFLNYFKDAVHQRQIRFFGMEHVVMMLLAVVLITIGSMRAKRQPDDKQKFRTMAIFFTIALLVILSSIPWQFSPLVSRPYFRSF